jgi:hypothetical protein
VPHVLGVGLSPALTRVRRERKRVRKSMVVEPVVIQSL